MKAPSPFWMAFLLHFTLPLLAGALVHTAHGWLSFPGSQGIFTLLGFLPGLPVILLNGAFFMLVPVGVYALLMTVTAFLTDVFTRPHLFSRSLYLLVSIILGGLLAPGWLILFNNGLPLHASRIFTLLSAASCLVSSLMLLFLSKMLFQAKSTPRT